MFARMYEAKLPKIAATGTARGDTCDTLWCVDDLRPKWLG
jgi:hypothetical protein